MHLTWPAPIAERLSGTSLLQVADSRRGRVVAQATVQFGDSPDRLRLIDDSGRPLSLSKYGRLKGSFDAWEDTVTSQFLDQTSELLELLRDRCGVPAFLSYGTLLGAVRAGRLIAHDSDVDLGYLSGACSPVEVMEESFTIQRELSTRRDWKIVRRNGGLLQVFPKQADGEKRNIDVFACFSTGATVYQVHDVAIPGDVSVVLPLTTVRLEGRDMPAPRYPERFLESAYGPTWRVPDPAFAYSMSSTRQLLGDWFLPPRKERDRWGRFYGKHGSDVPREPSPFARWARERMHELAVLDVGCGNGRDSVYFASRGYRTVGLDVVRGIRGEARKAARSGGLDLEFTTLDLNSLREVLGIGMYLRHTTPQPRAIYARFLLHTLSKMSRDNFFRLCSLVLAGGGRAYMEFRTPDDRRLSKHFANGPRHYLEPDDVRQEAESHHGRLVSAASGRGMATFHDEDPAVCRLVMEWD